MMTVDIAPGLLEVGDDVTAWFLPHGSSGQGGVVTEVHGTWVALESGTSKVRNEIMFDTVHHWTTEQPYPAEDCLNYNPDTCRGPVDDWWSGDRNGRTWPRCTFHGEKRLADRENSLERYADSDVSPFNEAELAEWGERWDDDY